LAVSVPFVDPGFLNKNFRNDTFFFGLAN